MKRLLEQFAELPLLSVAWDRSLMLGPDEPVCYAFVANSYDMFEPTRILYIGSTGNLRNRICSYKRHLLKIQHDYLNVKCLVKPCADMGKALKCERETQKEARSLGYRLELWGNL